MTRHLGRRGLAVREVVRTEPQALAGLARLGVATVHEAQGREGLLDHHLRPIQQDCCVSGSAITVLLAPGDNWMFHVAVELCQPPQIKGIIEHAFARGG